MLYNALSKLLFTLEAERSHDLAMSALRRLPKGLASLAFYPRPAPRPVRVMGIDFPNPVGLAAGLDKNAQCVTALGAMGFGFVEVGTVTPRPQAGKPRPRMFRLVNEKAIINRMGFNNVGIDAFVANLRRASYPGVLGVNIGKNYDTPNEHALDDYAACLRRVYSLADYVAVNISSPNTAGLRSLQDAASLKRLLAGLQRVRETLMNTYGYRLPLAVKISPDLQYEQVQTLAQTLTASGVDGVIATNTTTGRAGVEGAEHAQEAGGLSGRPLSKPSESVINWLADELGGKAPVIGVGGIMSGGDARRKRNAGAELIQLYTELIYHGPALVRECVRAFGDAR